MLLKLSQIKATQVTQSRCEINTFQVDDYVEALKNGDQFPPVEVFCNQDDYYLVDGFHRFEAYQKIGLIEVEAIIHDGDLRDAILYAAGVNADHGLPRTYADKRKAALTLLEDSEWGQWSDSEIARRCRVHQTFVSKLRLSLKPNISEKPKKRKVRTKHGTVSIMNTTNIGKKPVKDKMANLSPEKKEAIKAALETGQAETPKEAYKEIKSLEARQKRVENLQQISNHDSPLVTERRYPVIYADPPWKYWNTVESRDNQNHYPTMTLEDICALPIQDVCTSDAILFMWAISPELKEALKVIDAWGFNYQTSMVWVKDKIGLGWYVRNQHEFLLIATKGDFIKPAHADRPSSVINAPRLEHSAKPSIVYDIIEKMYPDLPKIELFCRTPRENWASWGNEI